MVAGDPPSEAKLARVRELGMIDQVRFPGLLDDVRASLASCHAGFVLSYREALSFACREIMGLGLPALVSDAGGLPENVTDGVDGWIVPVRDVPAMTARLRLMLDQPEMVRQMGRNAGNSCATSTCTVSPPPRWTSTSVRWLDADLIIRSMRIPILMYHQIGEPNPKGTPFRGLTVHRPTSPARCAGCAGWVIAACPCATSCPMCAASARARCSASRSMTVSATFSRTSRQC